MDTPNQEFAYNLSVDDFDKSIIPENAQTPGTDAFQKEVRRYFEKEYADFGGWVQIAVDETTIRVRWRPDPSRPDPLSVAIAALKAGDHAKGVRLLELLRHQHPDNVEVLRDLGMGLSDMGRLDEALEHLGHANAIAPDHCNTLVAIGVALVRQGKTAEAVPVLMQAVQVDANNSWAHRNLGACLLKTGKGAEAEQHLRRAVELDPKDQQSVFGLAEALRTNEDFDEADKLYISVIELDSRSSIAELARQERSRLAQASFKARSVGGVRPDAVMYLLGALRRFGKMNQAEVQRITFEIAILGQRGIDTNDPAQKYQLRSLPDRYSGMHLVCLMYAGFRQIAPEHSIGFDLSKEYAAAKALYQREQK